MNGDPEEDTALILDALRKGHAFVANDQPGSARGFRVRAHGKNEVVTMGDTISAESGVTIQIRLPLRTECLLLKDGVVIKTWHNRETCTHITTEAGVYRVETYIQYAGKRRGWIFSNPIYVYR